MAAKPLTRPSLARTAPSLARAAASLARAVLKPLSSDLAADLLPAGNKAARLVVGSEVREYDSQKLIVVGEVRGTTPKS